MIERTVVLFLFVLSQPIMASLPVEPRRQDFSTHDISQLDQSTKNQSLESHQIFGQFKVKSISQKHSELFLVRFILLNQLKTLENSKDAASPMPGKKFRYLDFYCHHPHLGLEIGKTVELKAIIDSISENSAVAQQILVFFPRAFTNIPVWLPSVTFQAPRFSGLLEMHYPRSDYLIF